MNNLYYFTHRVSEVPKNKNLDSHHNSHTKSKISISPKLLEVGKKHVNIKETSNIYAKTTNQFELKYQTMIWARFD